MLRDTLVSVEELQAHTSWRRIDCRHELADPQAGARSWAQGHIPGALHADLDRDLAGPAGGGRGRHPLPEPEAFLAWLGRCGLHPDDQVVVYDAADGAFAARLWWMLRAVGHRAVAVLDGGLKAWVAAGLPLTTEAPDVEVTRYEARWDPLGQVDTAALLEGLPTGQHLIVDARASNRYEGRDETIDPVAGHIPGALNRPYASNLVDGRFKPADQLAEEFRALLGARTPADVVHQCGSGVTACHNLLAMTVAGLPGSRLYPGSWSAWCSDPARPVATGPQPGG